MIGGLASGKRFIGHCCETVIGFCPYPMARDLELHSLASANGSEGDCREGDSEETLKRLVERRRDPWGRLVERKGHPGLPTIPKDLWKGSSESIARDREDRERTRDWRRKGER